MWLKEVGITVLVNIGEKLKKYPNNYGFEIGIGMYDPKTNKLIGLDKKDEDALALGIDLKKVMKL